MTLSDYVQLVGWNTATLARQAGIDWRTANAAISGQIVSARAARAIAQALSAELGRRINVGDIEGLNYR